MSNLYILNDQKQPILIGDTIEWAQWIETADRRVALTKINGYRVSTVFLGLDHSWGEEEGPLIFETMIFKEDDEAVDWGGELQYRYKTWDDAQHGHDLVVHYIKEHYEVCKNRVQD